MHGVVQDLVTKPRVARVGRIAARMVGLYGKHLIVAGVLVQAIRVACCRATKIGTVPETLWEFMTHVVLFELTA